MWASVPEQGLDGVVAEERSEKAADRRQVRDPSSCAAGTPCAVSPLKRAWGRFAASPTTIRLKKIPIDRTIDEAVKVAAMPAPAPRWSGGSEFMMPVWFGGGE